MKKNPFEMLLWMAAILAASAFMLCASCEDKNTGPDNGEPITDKNSKAEIPVSSISINEGDCALTAGAVKQLSADVLPANAADKSVIWSSDNEAIAAVSAAGLVTGIAKGSASITAAARDGSGISDTVTVMVTSSSVIMTPQEIFSSLKGQKAVTYGWADMANNGAGLSYADPAKLILIDDTAYPNAAAKYRAFIDANINNAAINDRGIISGTVNDNPKFIIISGDIDLSNGRISDSDKSWFSRFNTAPPYGRVNGDIVLNLGSNTTIIGINNARIMYGGIRINNRANIIIRNITLWDAHGSTEQDTGYVSESKASIDALEVRGSSNGIWVDHCTFTDGICNDMVRNYNHDGAFDIPQGKNITVSWSEFTNHDKVMLVAGSDSAANAVAEDRQITLHHNYFHSTTQRMPRTRGAQMHIYNNYYNNIGVQGNSGSYMGPGWGAQFIVENNYFGTKPLGGKTIEWMDSPEYRAKFYYTGNNMEDGNTTWWGRSSNPRPWIPAYFYTPEPCDDLPVTIPAAAGPSLVFVK